ncbi:MAG: hypothetical protein M3238_00895 [Actinomycetota bacterium]|nr:hypothetical protein [Actinomycetota bacterium]
MIRTSYLRVYQPLSAFPVEEREQWVQQASQDDVPDVSASRKWLLSAALPDRTLLAAPTEGALVRGRGDEMLICPWRTSLRMLAGLLAFRNSIPDEIADAFVPEEEARRAAHELATLGEEHPEIRSHILHANWHVPLRWFAAFDDSERILTEDKDGLRVRYECRLEDAKARLARAVSILESSWIDDGVTAAIRELTEWLEEFEGDGVLELDYGSVAGMFPDDELVEDRSAAEVMACLDALEAEDILRAGRMFGILTDRWTEVRAREVVN